MFASKAILNRLLHKNPKEKKKKKRVTAKQTKEKFNSTNKLLENRNPEPVNSYSNLNYNFSNPEKDTYTEERINENIQKLDSK